MGEQDFELLPATKWQEAGADFCPRTHPHNLTLIVGAPRNSMKNKGFLIQKCQTYPDLTLDVAASFACRAIALRAMRS
jgi:hypothetical protein